jgi:ActR/RegA family two-component response regulator
MTKKKVLIIEDNEQQRVSLHESLEVRGFTVYSAGRVNEARELAEKHWEDLDVAVLDMRLEDPEEPSTTGADIGIEFRRSKSSFPPESLIYSAYAEIDYYRLALKLGVAVYLSKQEDNMTDVIRHVRVLALRRALNGENPETADKVARVAVRSQSRAEAILKFCQSVLKPEFESCLGAPFVVLFSEGNNTQNCADNANLPPGSSQFYHTLQALAHGKGNLTEPFILEVSELEDPTDPEMARLYDKLNMAAFVPLSISQDFRLSIGILQERESEKYRVPEDARALCKVLGQYLRPTVLENMLSIWSQWTELRATRYNTAKLCLFVGQEVKDILPTPGEDELSLPEDSLGRLWNLADDLTDTGQLLTHLENIRWDENSRLVSAREIAETSWEWIVQAEGKLGKGFTIEGNCTIEADRGDLEIAVSRLLHWFAQRLEHTPFDVDPLVSVKCLEDAAGPTIIFEDRSQRLNTKLRENMFAPFTQAVPIPLTFDEGENAKQGASAETASGDTATGEMRRKHAGRYLPLYLAKMLVEGRYHGTLEDHSDDEDLKDRSYGHRIVMQFPPDRKKAEGFKSVDTQKP